MEQYVIRGGKITSYDVREFLEKEGKKLEEKDEKHYYYIRDRFNEEHNPLDFLFLFPVSLLVEHILYQSFYHPFSIHIYL